MSISKEDTKLRVAPWLYIATESKRGPLRMVYIQYTSRPLPNINDHTE